MEIVDSHVHLWGTSKPNPAHRQVPELTAETMLAEMDEAGVDAALIQPPAWDAASNEVAVEAARKYPKRFAVLGWFALDRPESRTRVATWRERPGMHGLRFTFLEAHQKSWPTDGTMDWLWPAAERAGLPVALACGDFLPTVGTVAERYPGLKLIVDHCGGVLRMKDDAAWVHRADLLALAKYPNVAVKASAVPGYSSETYPYRNTHAHLRAVYDAFGPKRMFWGTDITRMPCSYRQCVTMFTEELPWLSAADKALVMGRALCDWIEWKR